MQHLPIHLPRLLSTPVQRRRLEFKIARVRLRIRLLQNLINCRDGDQNVAVAARDLGPAKDGYQLLQGRHGRLAEEEAVQVEEVGLVADGLRSRKVGHENAGPAGVRAHAREAEVAHVPVDAGAGGGSWRAGESGHFLEFADGDG